MEIKRKKDWKIGLEALKYNGINGKEDSGIDSWASYIVLFENGYWKDYTSFEVCHASLLDEINIKASYVVSWVDKTHEYSIPFISWLIHRSPWSKAIVSKSVRSVFRNGIIMRTDVPSNFMAQALIITRQLWEYPEIVNKWRDLVKGGVDETLAFVLAHYGTYGKQVSWAENGGLHNAIAIYEFSKESTKNLMLGIMPNANRNYYDYTEYRGIFGLWGYAASALVSTDDFTWKTKKGTCWNDDYEYKYLPYKSFIKQLTIIGKRLYKEIYHV